ncbi:hypothetical protein [Ralstonia pseudosolanacearum]|uniref:hypothetical protein n=1 Tax=Ralstonia pseudosolanacearum TaxID=1310165 RepID=UPI003CE86EFD
MRIILFGASGMVGASALREALKAPEVESVLCIGRRSCGIEHHKLRELRLPDLFDFAAVEDQLTGFDACIWAIGISSVGLRRKQRQLVERCTCPERCLWNESSD